MDLISGALVLGGLILPVLLVAFLSSKPRYGFSALFFLFLFMADVFLTGIPLLFEITSIPGTEWNWIGKFFSLTLCLTVAAGSSFSFKELGFTTTQRAGTILPATLVTIVLVLLSVLLGFRFASAADLTTETILYQSTMPGIAEEIAYRGLLLAFLHSAMPARKGTFTYWWPAIITTLAFGLWHGIEVEGWNISLNFFQFLFPLAGGAAFVWMRELTGSLVFPIIAHNACNTAFFLAAII